jgi:hypothetical protein
VGGIGVSLVVIGIVVVAAALLAVLHFRFGLFGGKSRGRRRSPLLDESRVEVLESTEVDGDRRLVLVRCDRIEHLIMVGGPVDLVVENDVKKVRGPGVPAPKSAAGGLTDMLGGGAAPEHQAVERPAAERPAPAAAERRALAAPPRPGQEPAPAAPSRGDDTRRRMQPQHADESQPGRRESAQQQRRTIQPRPLGGPRQEPERERPASHGRGHGRGGESAPPLPAAGVPWTEPDSIENEIVQALRFDPVPRAGGKAAPPSQALAAAKDEAGSTTLGDLADRLEEALAQEVQSATHGSTPAPALDLDSDEFGFGRERPTGRSDPSSSQSSSSPSAKQEEPRSRPARTELPRAAEPKSSSSPEPERRRDTSASERERRRDSSVSSERRREPSASSERSERGERPERREEAPVISLNARRRESGDALEDEMARLLGELTGDTKGR